MACCDFCLPHIQYFGKHRTATSKGSVRRLDVASPVHGKTVSSKCAFNLRDQRSLAWF
jgi:hypothetical protein